MSFISSQAIKGSPIKSNKPIDHRAGGDLQGARGRGPLANEKPPIFGMIQRSGEVVIRMLENGQQETIKPLILKSVVAGAHVYTDEYIIYN
jgi:transposase-like protein